jgi:periplasmic protein TonB
MTFYSGTILPPREDRGLPRWVVALCIVLGLHIGIGAYFILTHRPDKPAGEPSNAIIIDLAPIATAPAQQAQPSPAPTPAPTPVPPPTETKPQPKAETPAPPTPTPPPPPEPLKSVPETPPVMAAPAPPPPTPVPEILQTPVVPEVALPPPTPALDLKAEQQKIEREQQQKIEHEKQQKLEQKRIEQKRVERERLRQERIERARQAKAERAKKERAERARAAAQQRASQAARAAGGARAGASGRSIDEWRSEVQARVSGAAHSISVGETGSATLVFTVDASGRVVSAHIARSSGSPALNRTITSIAYRLGRLPPPPNGRVSLSVLVRFN